MLEKTERINWLLDFYGGTLTEHQRELVELYYSDDLSLGEIAEQAQISRQAVYDTLRRAVESLERWEEKLGMVARYRHHHTLLFELSQLLEEIFDTSSPNPRLERAREIARLLVNDQ
ncbi:MAG: YlxM family DNA-binding protein [Bacillota bacterium]